MKKAFSIVELMLVVSIIGILATVAIPQYLEMQLKARRAEAPMNVDSIATYAIAYFNSSDEWLDGCALNPAEPLGKTARRFSPTADACWTALDWEPDGLVRCSYMMERFGSGLTSYNRVTGQCDVDDDGNFYFFRRYVVTPLANGYSAEVDPQYY